LNTKKLHANYQPIFSNLTGIFILIALISNKIEKNECIPAFKKNKARKGMGEPHGGRFFTRAEILTSGQRKYSM